MNPKPGFQCGKDRITIIGKFCILVSNPGTIHEGLDGGSGIHHSLKCYLSIYLSIYLSTSYVEPSNLTITQRVDFYW